MYIEIEGGIFMYLKEYPRLCAYGESYQEAREEINGIIEIYKSIYEQRQLEDMLIEWGVDLDTAGEN